jgi:hypothetical protein
MTETGERTYRDQSQAWTVGDLRQALDGIPDHTPLNVSVDAPDTDREAQTQVVTGAGPGQVDPGDGSGPIPNGDFTLTCEVPKGRRRRHHH